MPDRQYTPTKFRDLFRQHVVDSGMSLYQIARRCHHHWSYLSRLWHAERINPQCDFVIELCLKGLDLSREQTDEMLLAAGHAPIGRE